MPAGYAGTFDSADVAGWTPAYFYLSNVPAGYAGTFDSADVATWAPTTFYLSYMPAGYAGTFDSADLVGWTPTTFYFQSMPAGYIFTITPAGFATWITTTALYMDNNSLTQAQVDQILDDLYTAFATRVPAGGSINVAGTNAAPSGIFQAQCPPLTGKEFAFELLNDSCLVNPTKVWATVTTN
jgi:hypothetical protein